MLEIHKVAVIGAGAMGAAIAAHVANAGVRVRLYDVASSGEAGRNAIATAAIARLLTTDPAPLMHRRNAERITPQCVDDDLHLIADCDWIVEAVIERIEVKRALYLRIEQARRPGSIVSSNTSTIRLAALLDGLPESFARDFLITHFFNPPRYLRLLEMVPGPATRAEAVAAIERFADFSLGKTVGSLQGHSRLHRQPDRHLLAPVRGRQGDRAWPSRRGGRCDHEQADRRAEDRHFRAARHDRHRSHAPCAFQHGRGARRG